MEEEDHEYIEVKNALTSMVTCSIVAHSIREAFATICDIKDKPVFIPKSELMIGIKRDYRFNKVGQFKRNIQDNADEILAESQYRRDEYLNSFLRNYQGEAIKNIKLTIQPQLSSYQKIKILDLSGQLQSNSEQYLSELIPNLAGCSVEVLVLSNNKITDEGLKIIAPKLRSLNYLHTLFLNHNKFTDNGIESLFRNDNYSTSLKVLNISYNILGKTSAWFIGRLFAPGKVSNLEELFIGGQVNYHHSIDSFFISLIPHLLFPGGRKLRKLDISASGLTSQGISALITLISWTTSIESLNLSRIAIESSKYRYEFILSLIMNQSLQHLTIHQCGFRLNEMNSLQLFIETRQYNSNALNKYLPVSYRRIDWIDQMNFIQHIITQRTILEQKRIEEEEEIIKLKYTPPPVLRPMLMTKNQQSQIGCGISSQQKNSMYLSLEEIAKLNPMSIVGRTRRSIAIIDRNPIIKDRYKYPNSVINNLKNEILFQINQNKNEEIKKEEKHLIIQRTKTQILITKEINLTLNKTKNKKKINKMNYLIIENNCNLEYEEYKKQKELIKYYIELQQLKDKITIKTIFTNLEIIYCSFFIFNDIKKEILLINTPHQYSHLMNTKNILFEITLIILLLLKEIILNEMNLKNNLRKFKNIKNNIKCNLLNEEIMLKKKKKKEMNLNGNEIIEINEERVNERNGQDGEERNNNNNNKPQSQHGEDDEEEIADLNGNYIKKRGIGREKEYEEYLQTLQIIQQNKNKIIKKYENNSNYENILNVTKENLLSSLNYFQHLIYFKSSKSLFSSISTSSDLTCLYDYYLFFYDYYLRYFKRYILLTNEIILLFNECILILKLLNENHLIYDEYCYQQMLFIEMFCHEIISLQNELNILIQILISIFLYIEIIYNENVYNSSFQYSNLIPVTLKYNPSCPISYSAIIRAIYPQYNLITVYLGFYFLNEEIFQRIKASSVEESNSRVTDNNNKDNNNNNNSNNAKKDKIDDLHSLISYKSLESYDELSLSTRQTNETTQAAKHSNKKAFQPKKGKRMKYPTQQELDEKMRKKTAIQNDMEEEGEEITKTGHEEEEENGITYGNNDKQQEQQFQFQEIEKEKDKNSFQEEISVVERKNLKTFKELEEEDEDEEQSKQSHEQRNSNGSIQLLPELPSIEKLSSSTLTNPFNRNNSQEKSQSMKSIDEISNNNNNNNESRKLTLPKLHSARSNMSIDFERDDVSVLTDGNSYSFRTDYNNESIKEESKKSSKKKKGSK